MSGAAAVAPSRPVAVALGDFGEVLGALRLCIPALLQRIERSLSRLGQLTPVVVYKVGGRLELIDGFKRLRAARSLGWKVLRAEVQPVDTVGAKLLLMQSNSSMGLSDLEQAWLVRSLYREDGLSQPQIGQFLGRHKSWVCRRLMLAEGLSDEVEGGLRLGLLSATAVRELARLPRGNQDAAARVVSRRGLTTRQVAHLVDALVGAEDEAARQRIIEEMDRAPEPGAPSKVKRGSAGRTPGERIVADASALTRLSVRLSTRLLERPLPSLGQGAAEVAVRSLGGLQPTLVSLCQTIEHSLAQMEVGHEEVE